MATRLNSEDWVPKFSADAGVTWLTLICPTSWTFGGSTETTKTSTLTCGVLQSVGAFGAECSAEAVSDVAPGATEVSIKQVLSWATNKTALKFKAEAGVGGADLFVSGDSVISQAEVVSTADDYVRFNISWTVENIDITPA